VQQVLQLQTQRQEGDPETCPNDKREVVGNQGLQTTVRACTHWNLSNTVQPPRGRSMPVVQCWTQDSGPDAGTPLPRLQPVQRPVTDNMEGGGKCDGLERGQMQIRADL